MQKIFRIKVVIVFFFLLTFLILAEITLRVIGNYKTYTEKIKNEYSCTYGRTLPYFHLHNPESEFILDHTDFKYLYTINKNGIREVDFNKEKQKTAKRVLCFGDSFTEGVGAPYDSSYVRALEKQLKKKSTDFEVYNCAVTGSDPFYNYILLKEEMIDYDPDVVTFTINNSDLTDFIFTGGLERFKVDKVVTRKKPFFEPFFHYSHLVRFIAIEIMGYDWTLLNTKDNIKMLTNGVEEYLKLFVQINEICETKGVEFLLIIQPHPVDILYPVGMYKYLISMKENLIKNNIKYIDLLPSLAEVMNNSNIYQYSWKTDGHYNSSGYQILGEKIFSETEKKYPDFWVNKN